MVVQSHIGYSRDIRHTDKFLFDGSMEPIADMNPTSQPQIHYVKQEPASSGFNNQRSGSLSQMYSQTLTSIERSKGQAPADVTGATGVLLAVQTTVVVVWVKYGDWLMTVLYISSAEKTAPGVSSGGMSVMEVAEALLRLTNWPC